MINVEASDKWKGPVVRAPKRPENGPYTVDKYVRNTGLSVGRNNTGGIDSRGDEGLYFPDALNAEIAAGPYTRVTNPKVGDRLIYVEEEGPTLYGTVTRAFGTGDYRQIYFRLNKKGNKEILLFASRNGLDYLLFKDDQVRSAARTRSNRENALRNGPHRRNNRFKGGFKSQRASRRSVTRR